MLWFIALGSALGGVARYALGGAIQRWSGPGFPAGTLVVNIAGSFLLGFLLRYALGAPSISPELRAFLTIGFCGGFTTFSTFSYESVTLLESGQWNRLALYVGLSLVLALGGAILGVVAAREVLLLRRTL